MTETIYILCGSNLGDREENISTSISRMKDLPGIEIVASSSIYLSEADGMEGENPDFLNQVVMAEYQYLPSELLGELESIEATLGRTDKGKRKPRPIDLDILLFGEQIIDLPHLQVPHPKLLNRHFAMLPLLQISPDLVHPVTKRPIADSLKKSRTEKVLLYGDYVTRNV